MCTISVLNRKQKLPERQFLIEHMEVNHGNFNSAVDVLQTLVIVPRRQPGHLRCKQSFRFAKERGKKNFFPLVIFYGLNLLIPLGNYAARRTLLKPRRFAVKRLNAHIPPQHSNSRVSFYLWGLNSCSPFPILSFTRTRIL